MSLSAGLCFLCFEDMRCNFLIRSRWVFTILKWWTIKKEKQVNRKPPMEQNLPVCSVWQGVIRVVSFIRELSDLFHRKESIVWVNTDQSDRLHECPVQLTFSFSFFFCGKTCHLSDRCYCRCHKHWSAHAEFTQTVDSVLIVPAAEG